MTTNSPWCISRSTDRSACTSTWPILYTLASFSTRKTVAEIAVGHTSVFLRVHYCKRVSVLISGLAAALHIKSVQATFPSFSRRGDRAIHIVRTRGRGGYVRTAKRSFLLKLLTAPSAPAKEREHYLM